jgi:hypothetical protein
MAASTNLTPAERKLRARSAVNASWANTADRATRTAPATAAFLARFEREVDPLCELPQKERALRAESAKKAYFLALAYRASRAKTAKADEARAQLQDPAMASVQIRSKKRGPQK